MGASEEARKRDGKRYWCFSLAGGRLVEGNRIGEMLRWREGADDEM